MTQVTSAIPAKTLREILDVPPPPGRSRESSIRLDYDGQFHHDDEPFVHRGLADAMHTWITRHPDNGRFVLYNGYDWSYFTVDDAPYVVRHLDHTSPPRMVLSDGTAECLGDEPLWTKADTGLYTLVKRKSAGGPFQGRFSRHAQTELARYLVLESHAAEASNQSERDDVGAQKLALRIGDREVPIGVGPSFG
jgi:uncharacterized protein